MLEVLEVLEVLELMVFEIGAESGSRLQSLAVSLGDRAAWLLDCRVVLALSMLGMSRVGWPVQVVSACFGVATALGTVLECSCRWFLMFLVWDPRRQNDLYGPQRQNMRVVAQQGQDVCSEISCARQHVRFSHFH